MRKTELTSEEKKENRRIINKNQIPVRFPPNIFSKFENFSKQYKSKNACILDLIKTHPDFQKFQ